MEGCDRDAEPTEGGVRDGAGADGALSRVREEDAAIDSTSMLSCC